MTSRRANTPRDWALAIGGGLLLSVALVAGLRGGWGDADAPALPAAPASSPAPLPAPAPATTPAPAPAPVSLPSPTSITAAPDLALAGLRAGPDGGMAIVVSGGRQWLLRPGRSIPGGPKLLRVEPGRAVLEGPAGEIVLAFADPAVASAGPAATPPGGDPTPWRLALRPVAAGGRLAGWRLDTLAGLPALARAGLQPGDIVLAANGAELISEEKVMELPQELAANGRLALRYSRGGAVREAVVQP